MLTVVLRIRHQPRRRSNYRIAARGQNARRDSSCRSASLFNQYGAAAGGARNGVLAFARAGWRYKAPWWLPRRKNKGSGGRRDRALLNAREPPPAVFWFLLYRYKRNSPAGEIHTCLFVARQNGRMISAPTKQDQHAGKYGSHPLTYPQSGAEAKRSFAESSLPSFLSRKRARKRDALLISYKEGVRMPYAKRTPLRPP